MCSACHLLQPRALTEKDLNLDIAPVPEIPKSACRRCRAKHQRLVPQPEDVPMPLRDLSTDILHALRPLDIDVGPEVRASGGGYGLPDSLVPSGRTALATGIACLAIC